MSKLRRDKERGSAMLVTMIVVSALLAGAAVLASIQMSSNRSTELTRNGLAALYCAEAGLTKAKQYVSSNYGNWNAALAANCAASGPDPKCSTLVQPAWLDNTVFSHDLDTPLNGDDFVVYIRDNDDDTVGLQNYGVDGDDQVFIVARCTKYTDTPKQVEELIKYKPALNPYEGPDLVQGQGNACNAAAATSSVY